MITFIRYMQSSPRVSASLDTVAAVPTVGAILHTLPEWSVLPAACWYLLQIWESKTVTAWRTRIRGRLTRRKS